MLLFDFLYFILLALTVPFWIIYLFKSDHRRLIGRRLSPRIRALGGRSIWIHAVSVGEVRSLKGLIRILSQRQSRRLVLSVTTPAGFACARQEYPQLIVVPAPFDFLFCLKRFLARIDPDIVIFNELEVWPNWIYLLRKRAIPTVLINGRMSDAAFHRYAFFRFLMRPVLSRVNRILVQSDVYRERFLSFGIDPEKVRICGSIKADEAWQAVASLPRGDEVRSRLQFGASGKRLVTVASSHFADECLLIPALPRLVERFFFIIVPRHPHRAGEIEQRLAEAGVPCVVFSRRDNRRLNGGVLIFDQIGYLFPILSISDLVVMGGTQERRIGGHNLFEPAVLGKPIVGGRHFNNFPGIGQSLVDQGVYHLANSTAELAAFFQASSRLDLKTIKARAIAEVDRRRGALSCTVKELQRMIAF